MNKSFEAIQRAAIAEIDTVGEFSLGDIDFDVPAAPAPVAAPRTVNGVRTPARYLRPFAEYRPSDMGNAERFYDLFADQFRYAPHLGWLTYDNGLWARCASDGEAREAVKDTIKQMGDALAAEEALIDPNSDTYEKDMKALGRMRTHYEASCSEPKYGACLRTAASDRAFLVKPEDLDADDFKLNTQNGILDLVTGEVLPHSPSYLMTRTSATSIGSEDAQCPVWLDFLHAALHDGNDEETAEMIDWMQVLFAYLLSGSTRFEKMPIFGSREGGTGKSTTLGVLNDLTGTYGIQVDCKMLQYKNAEDTSIPNDLAKTAGSRVTTIDELPKGFVFNSPLTKKYISGSTPMTARFLNKEFFEWKSKSKVVIATNFLPVIRDDEAMWRRIMLVRFNNSFKSNPDEQLGAKLKAEMPAIMRWAQQGIAKLATRGLWTPVRVARDTEAYRLSQDDFGGFIADKLELGAGYTVKTSQAFSMYKAWAEDNKHHAMSKSSFRRTMNDRGYADQRKNTGEVFLGLRVKQEELDLS